MKRLFKTMMFFAISASVFFACSKEISEVDRMIPSDDDWVELTITTGRPEMVNTRTMVAEDGTTPLWCPGDAIGVVVRMEDLYTNNKFVSESTEDSRITSFKGKTPVAGEIYTYYPFSSNEVNDSGNVLVEIPAIQKPTGTSFDGAADVLVGKPVNMAPSTTEIEDLQFKRVGGFLKIVLTDKTNKGILAAQSINSLSVRAERNLAGSVSLDLINGELGEICGSESKNVTATYSPAMAYRIGDGNAATYLGVYPQTLAEGSMLTISASTEEYGITKSIKLPCDIIISAGQITTLNVNITDENVSVVEPCLLAISIDGVSGEQIDETVFQIKMPYGTNVTALKPEFVTNGASVELKDEQSGLKDVSSVDLSSPVTFTLVSSTGQTKDYTVVVYYSELPIVYVNTPETITSKDVWMDNCSIQIWNAADENSIYNAVQMKGRGNTTWGQPKKPYAIKLDKKAEVLGMPKHKRWVLLANHMDITAGLRNEICFYMGRISNLPYTPRTRFVDVVMNKEYVGLYQVTEQLKIDDNRVAVGDDGFLLEIDSRAGQDPEDIYFKVPHIGNPLVIKDPDVEEGDEAYHYIKQFVTDASTSLFSDDFTDEEIGWRKYLDADSFVDWYLINEITRNNDAVFFSSCYMSLKLGGKLMMGPLWDFDLAIANTNVNDSKNPVGFWIKRVAWYTRLFTDPYFVSLVKERFSYFYENRQKIYDELHYQQGVIEEAMSGNEVRWNRMGTKGNAEQTRQQLAIRVENMCTWLETRFNWMKEEFDNM